MQLAQLAAFAPTVTTAPRPTPAEVVEDAITRLDWAHEEIGGMESEPEATTVEDLELSSGYARSAVDLLGTLRPSDTTFDITTASEQAAKMAAALEEVQVLVDLKPGDPSTIAAVTKAAEVSEAAIHLAYQALGTDRG